MNNFCFCFAQHGLCKTESVVENKGTVISVTGPVKCWNYDNLYHAYDFLFMFCTIFLSIAKLRVEIYKEAERERIRKKEE